MGNETDKVLILNRIKEAYNLAGNSDLARFLGVAPNTITNWYSRNSIDYDLVFTKCVNVSSDWLLTGRGPMIRDDARGSAPTPLSKDTQSGIVAAIATDERPAPVSTIIYEHDPGDLKLIAAQEKTIAAQEKTIAAQERRIGDLEGRGFRPERSSGAPSADFPYTSSGKNPLLK